jgi:alkylation response protein AidB-like acyl-CoA dehydrogenase
MSMLSQGVGFALQNQFAPGILATLKVALERIDQAELATLPSPSNQAPSTRRVLVDTPELMIVAVRWRAGAKGELHSYPGTAGLHRVISGTAEEERYLLHDGEYIHGVELLAPHDESYLPPRSFHQLRALEETVTLHAYSPRPSDIEAELSPQGRHLLADARRNSKAFEKPARIEFPQWGVKSSRHDKTVEKLADQLAPRWGRYEAEAYDDGSDRAPYPVLDEIRSSGILAAPIPRYWGGLTASLTETARALTQIATHAPSAALALVAPLSHAAATRIPLSTVPREQAQTLRENQRWIAEQATRGRILTQANPEPAPGDQQPRTTTIASRGIDANYYLTGKKLFATLGPAADYFFCTARTAVDIETPHGTETTIRIEGYYVHRDAPGISFHNEEAPTGMRLTGSVELDLEYTPAERLYAYPGAISGVNAQHWSTLLLSAVFLGIGQAALAEGVRNAGDSPWVRAKLADHALSLDAAAGYLEATCEAETWPMPKQFLDRAERVKTFVTQTVVQAVTQVAMASGSRCYSANRPTYRFVADALAGSLLRPPLGKAMETIMDQLVA